MISNTYSNASTSDNNTTKPSYTHTMTSTPRILTHCSAWLEKFSNWSNSVRYFLNFKTPPPPPGICPTFTVGRGNGGSLVGTRKQPNGPACVAECLRIKEMDPSINGVLMWAEVNDKDCWCVKQMTGINAGVTHLRTCKFEESE